MRYSNIRDNLRKLKIFTLNDIRLIDSKFRKPTLSDWVRKGWIKRIRRGWYIDSGIELRDMDYFFVANKIYSPSYISLESALSYYGYIPEAVVQITSVSTIKTQNFNTQFGTYVYQSLKDTLFFGYEILPYQDRRILIASREKCILDYLYFHSEVKDVKDFEELRFNIDSMSSTLNMDIINQYLDMFNSEELKKRFKILKMYLDA